MVDVSLIQGFMNFIVFAVINPMLILKNLVLYLVSICRPRVNRSKSLKHGPHKANQDSTLVLEMHDGRLRTLANQ